MPTNPTNTPLEPYPSSWAAGESDLVYFGAGADEANAGSSTFVEVSSSSSVSNAPKLDIEMLTFEGSQAFTTVTNLIVPVYVGDFISLQLKLTPQAPVIGITWSIDGPIVADYIQTAQNARIISVAPEAFQRWRIQFH